MAMPFKSEAQRRWMHANKPEMADRWEEHTPKGKKLPEKVKKKKSESIEDKLGEALIETDLTPILESRGHKPALILMNRGTLIPVHHARKALSPNSGEPWIIAGIDPGKYERIYEGGYPAVGPWFHKLRDFYGPGQWIPCRRYVERGWQDETGWFEANEDGSYDATRDYMIIKKFRKILTMKEDNVRTIEMLDPGVDPKMYEYKTYDDHANWHRKNRIRGTRLD